MSLEPCECLKGGDILGIVFMYLAMVQDDPSGYALQLNANGGEWKGRKKCPLSLVSVWTSHSAFRKGLRCQGNPQGWLHHLPTLRWVPAELLGWFLRPSSLPLHSTTGNLQLTRALHLVLLHLLQALIVPSVDSLLAVLHLPPLLFYLLLLLLLVLFLLFLTITVFLYN